MSNKGRGKPKLSLRDLSRQHPTMDEARALVEGLNDSPAVAAAIMGASLVEHDVERLLRSRLPRRDDRTWRDLTEDRGPAGTLSQKIALAHALGLLPDNLRRNLDHMRHIRNAFAHAKRPIQFNHPLVLAEMRKVSGSPRRFFGLYNTMPNDLTPAQAHHVYVGLCISLSSALMLVQVRKHNKAARSRAWRQARRQGMASGLADYAPTNPPGTPLFGLIPNPNRRTAGPKPEGSKSSYYDQFLAAGKRGRNKGK